MIRIFLARFWVVLLPFMLYGLWLIIITRKAKDGKYVGEHIRKAAFFWTCCASALLLIISCVWWSLSQSATGDAKYIRAHNIDGKVVPSQIIEHDDSEVKP